MRWKEQVNFFFFFLTQCNRVMASCFILRWPLRWLRRYGCDDELFSFESGRRCATGTGIFAFKCSNAATLFNLVHENLERAGEDDHRAQQHLPSVQHQAPFQQSTHITSHIRDPYRYLFNTLFVKDTFYYRTVQMFSLLHCILRLWVLLKTTQMS